MTMTIDMRPIAYICGLVVVVLGLTMLIPMGLDYIDGHENWINFASGGLMTVFAGSTSALAARELHSERLSIQQTFLLTTSIWLILPIFGALPIFFSDNNLRVVEAFFEAMSGLTTTGATILTGLEHQSRGILLWRAMLQWFGGIGIVVVAMAFLPALRVGGMQIFRTEGFDTFGKILPRAAEIARSITTIYLGLTALCTISYITVGLSTFDALTHAMTTIATGGFSNYDQSFATLGGGAEYVGMVFMLLSALPFVRYVQLMAGNTNPFYEDSQVLWFLWVVLGVVTMLSLWQYLIMGQYGEHAFRKVAFNSISILTGTGYASADYMLWGTFPVMFLLFIGLIGGCAGSTTCSIKLFRFQLLFASIQAQIRRLHSPNGIFQPRYGGRSVDEDVISSVIAFFMFFFVSLAVVAFALSLTGLDFLTSVSGAIAALANIGPGMGHLIGPSGNYSALSDGAKWILAITMLIGRLELLAVFVLLTPSFWRG